MTSYLFGLGFISVGSVVVRVEHVGGNVERIGQNTSVDRKDAIQSVIQKTK